MTSLRFLLPLLATFTLSRHSLIAQGKADSSSAAAPKLGGKWLLRARLGVGPYVVIFAQTGNKLRGDFAAHVSCAGQEVRMSIVLEGEVTGSQVRLRAT